MENEIPVISFVSTFNYRDISLPIYYNENFGVYSTIIDGQETQFPAFSNSWQEDLKYLIDTKLDLITVINEYPGAKLEWFFNGYNNRDIRLVYKTRVLKVFLVHNPDKITAISLSKLKQESLKILKKILELSNSAT